MRRYCGVIVVALVVSIDWFVIARRRDAGGWLEGAGCGKERGRGDVFGGALVWW